MERNMRSFLPKTDFRSQPKGKLNRLKNTGEHTLFGSH